MEHVAGLLIAVIIVIGYVLLGWALVAIITCEAERDPVTRAEWHQVRLPMWQMVIAWPVIYAAMVGGAWRKWRRDHGH